MEEILLIDKPRGITSFDVIRRLRFLSGAKKGEPRWKMGHAGTLDPMASGLMIIAYDKSTKKFCSIYCAAQWFKNNVTSIDHVIVTDEIRGNKIDSYMAYFVESELITNETNDNRIHVFQQRQDAITHAEKFHGTMTDDPFAIDE